MASKLCILVRYKRVSEIQCQKKKYCIGADREYTDSFYHRRDGKKFYQRRPHDRADMALKGS